nr:hypothetical protein [Tanacetum cinerariifolium]
IIRTDNGTEFKNQVIKEYFDTVGISHEMYFVQTSQQNGVVERRNRTLVEAARTILKSGLQSMTSGQISSGLDLTYAPSIITTQQPTEVERRNRTLVEAARTMLIFSRAPLFLWAEAIATAIFNRRTKKIMETMIVSFDELSVMAFEQRSSKPGLQCMTSGQISLGLDLTCAPSTITKQQPTEGELNLLFEAMYDDYFGGQPSATLETVPPVQEPQVRQTSTAFTTIADNVPISTNSSSHATNIPITSQDVDELNPNAMNVKEAMTDPAWTDSMQEELLQFKRLDVWVLVPTPDNISPLTLK